MKSKLAKQTIEKWWSEGLKPTFEDIVLMNALGLKVEHNQDSMDLSVLPRCAFIGENIIWEPSIRKQMWIDKAYSVVDTSKFENKLLLLVFALWCAEDELPELNNASKLADVVGEFASRELIGYTQVQLLNAVDYVLNGNDPTTGEDISPDEPKQDSNMDLVEFPEQIRSMAHGILAQAAAYGIQNEFALNATCPQLERALTTAIMLKGSDIFKNESVQCAAKFYAASGRIHTRLLDEKNKTLIEEEGKKANGEK